ncbi:phenylacetyl-CoA ligase [Laetiporus sulphureus 93-53]|uniref:Phenylacetyl-CoA ligase n=1 Tax=Laetiporus sulphureus 93-53 TaxID=1314785 RepID=A0A165DGM0_9APHY|nr:phenylacetyl-CoA ligase [Laetiporus sulphureus 93-53]KZT04841.1 phenylacetyl-CoA ligase [Laetiporus sulphureus 93-53]
MTIFESPAPAQFVPPLDDVTLPQFILDDVQHRLRPTRPTGTPCLIEEEIGRELFLEEVRTRTDAFARTLNAKWGIGKDDVVALCSPNHIDYPIAIWAAHRLGAIAALISPALTSSELVYHLQIAQPSLLIAHADNLTTALDAASSVGLPPSRVLVFGERDGQYQSMNALISHGGLLPPIVEYTMAPGEAREKIAVLCFSSGTTGKPKAVAVSHYNIICNVMQCATHLRLGDNSIPWDEQRFRPGDKCAAVLPLYHIYGIVSNLHFCLYSGMSVVIVQKYSHEGLLRSIERLRITHLFLVPPQVLLFCKSPATKKYDLSSVRFCIVAAAPLTAELTAQFLEVFPDIQLGQGYGLTETCAAVTLWPISQKVGTPGSAGQLISGTQAKVVKSDGSLAGVGEPGELYVKGGQVVLGYYRNEEATKEAFSPDGWFRTGDEVVFKENGDVFITDRIKELIKVKGFQVAPAELEGHLLGHAHVADVGVIGVPDAFAGELPLAFVVLQPKIAARVQADAAFATEVQASIFKHVADAKTHYKWLAGGIVFIEAIPKNPSGKILRRMLRERAKALRVPAVRARL